MKITNFIRWSNSSIVNFLVKVGHLSQNIAQFPSFIAPQFLGQTLFSINVWTIQHTPIQIGLNFCTNFPTNPMTKRYKLLPRTRERPVTRFYPNGEATLVGLACNILTLKYSVVLADYHRMFGRRPERTFICMVFDSDSNKWKKFVAFHDDHFTHMNRNQAVYINGSLHWLTSNCSYVLVLDLESETWRKISLPNQVTRGSGNRVHLLELEGRLSVIQISDVWMRIWVMEFYERKLWFLLDRVSLRCIRGMVPGVSPITQTDEYVFLTTHNRASLEDMYKCESDLHQVL